MVPPFNLHGAGRDGREHNALASFLSRKVEGLLLAPVTDEAKYIDAFLARNIPVVTFGPRLGRSDVPTVYSNNVEVGDVAAEHLLSLGHRSVVLVNRPEFISWSHDRRLGAEQAIRRKGLDPAEALFEVVVPDMTAEYGQPSISDERQRNGATQR